MGVKPLRLQARDGVTNEVTAMRTVNLRHVVSFSGGKDSTAMLIRMLEENMKIDEIIFADTGIEFPEMYEHIKQVEEYIKRPITTIRAENSFKYYMLDHIKTRGKNKGKAGYSWPDFRNRWCNTVLKQNVFKDYLKGLDVIEYHGISYDERERASRNAGKRNIKYPLIDWEMTEKDCLKYCYKHGFNWGGLYEKFDRVSCYLCPLQRLKELKTIYKEFPELWSYMRELDKKSIKLFGRKFRADYSIKELEEKFNKEDMNKF